MYGCDGSSSYAEVRSIREHHSQSSNFFKTEHNAQSQISRYNLYLIISVWHKIFHLNTIVIDTLGSGIFYWGSLGISNPRSQIPDLKFPGIFWSSPKWKISIPDPQKIPFQSHLWLRTLKIASNTAISGSIAFISVILVAYFSGLY